MRRRAAVELLLVCLSPAMVMAPDLIRGDSALSAAPPAWNYSGFVRFPAFYFGAAEGTGTQSAQELEFVARHALSGWGWQQGHGAKAHGEAEGQQAAARLRALAPLNFSASPDALFVYRQSESLFTYYDLMAAVEDNTSLASSAQLHAPSNASQLCGGGGLLSYSEQPFLDYWVNTVGGEVAAEPHVDAVFYDGFDKLYSGGGLASSCPGFTPQTTAAALRAKVAATARQADLLNQHGRTPILSTYNSLVAHDVGASRGVGATAMNGVSENDYAQALAGKSWLRFYEVWMGHGAAGDAAQLANAIHETALGIPFVVRADPKLLPKGSLEYPACAFLIAQVRSGSTYLAITGAHVQLLVSVHRDHIATLERALAGWIQTGRGTVSTTGKLARRWRRRNVAQSTSLGWPALFRLASARPLICHCLGCSLQVRVVTEICSGQSHIGYESCPVLHCDGTSLTGTEAMLRQGWQVANSTNSSFLQI